MVRGRRERHAAAPWTDEQISFRHAERLQEALRGNPAAEFLFGDYGRHGELSPELEARIRRFFLKHLGGT